MISLSTVVWKIGAARFQFVAQLRGVGEIAVVRDGDLAARAIDGQRLGVAQVRRAGGGIARVADGHVADEAVQDFAVENLRDQAHAACARGTACRRDVTMPALSWPRCCSA